jgi:hypothetical protein
MTKNARLVKELKGLVKGLPIDVLGHLEAPALCCRAGTVAIVKIDKGDPAPRTAVKAARKK